MDPRAPLSRPWDIERRGTLPCLGAPDVAPQQALGGDVTRPLTRAANGTDVRALPQDTAIPHEASGRERAAPTGPPQPTLKLKPR
ncbi:hypothetical protein VP06_06490 [Methylobacterium aquaticum]|uniref:Uncharacterized protein n=1 Tax=Methylobacterium aquaticum TaxID=270351 RepID=A0A0J6SXJ0_9HYPH|nr:hypothetical protein VP06_06490 [Methylobacterium aquaticum]